MSGPGFQLQIVTVGDEPDAWAAAGFTVTGGVVWIGSTAIVCTGDGSRGVRHVTIDGVTDDVDGLAVATVPIPARPADLAEHPNVVSGFDHLVAMSPAMERTSTALQAAGLEHRRTRTFEAGGEMRRQDFFWLGDVILELVGLDGVEGDGPASWWGLALECRDLDLAAERLGDALGRVKDAVQPGRRIATVRTRDLGVSVPIALMSPHPRG